MSATPIVSESHATAPRPASGALTKTGGFLAGYSAYVTTVHRLRVWLCDCYVQGLSVHQCHQPRLDWGDYVHPRIGIAERLAHELACAAAKDQLDQLAIFMSSATDPYQGAERRWRLSRACVEVMALYQPGLLVVQTCSPLVRDDFDRLAAFGERCWLSMTLETDDDDVRRHLTPRCCSIEQRWVTGGRGQGSGVAGPDRGQPVAALHRRRAVCRPAGGRCSARRGGYLCERRRERWEAHRTHANGHALCSGGLGRWEREDVAQALDAALDARIGVSGRLVTSRLRRAATTAQHEPVNVNPWASLAIIGHSRQSSIL